MTVVGILHPGEMGAAFGAVLRSAGHSVLWISAGRSDATRARGSPPTRSEPRLFLAGAHAAQVAELFAGTPVETHVLAGPPGEASAVKCAYAAWTKGSGALLLAIRAFACAEGVETALLEEWAASLPELEHRSEAARRSAETKGWRWSGEMEEIASAFAAHGLPHGFHEAAADVYRRPPA